MQPITSCNEIEINNNTLSHREAFDVLLGNSVGKLHLQFPVEGFYTPLVTFIGYDEPEDYLDNLVSGTVEVVEVLGVTLVGVGYVIVKLTQSNDCAPQLSVKVFEPHLLFPLELETRTIKPTLYVL